MTPPELIQKLVSRVGPCLRLCSYCPEDINTGEVKECVEKMLKEIYALQAEKDMLLEDIIKIRKAYREVTGVDYRDDR